MPNESSSVIAFGGNTMVYEAIKRQSLKELRDLIRVLMENVDDALFDYSEKAGNDRERTMYFDAMRLVRLKRRTLEDGFDSAMRQSFDDLILDRKPADKGGDGSGELELSLVEHEEIEDQLAIDNMILKARPRFEDDLYALRERLCTVLHRKQVDDDLNPFDPKAICESFHQACSVLETEIEVKLVLYKLFDRFVIRSLGEFYDKINEYFVLKGVLPELQPSRERLKEGARRALSRSGRGGYGGRDEGAGLDDTDSAAMAEGNVLALLQQALMPGMAPAHTGQPPGGAGQPLAAGQSGAAPASGPAVVEGALSPAFASALQGLQTAPIVTGPVEQVDPGEMKTRLQQQMSVFREEHRHQVGASEEQIIDIVSMLFDFFFDDKALPDPIKVLIGRLQIPILKVAILDKTFFTTKKHPARKLLDNISKASLGWSEEAGQEQKLIDEIERIVNFLINEFDQDVSVFEQALGEFEAFREQERQRLAEELEQMRREEQEREQRLTEAREAADALIGGLIDGRDLSFDVIEFLQGTWLQVLVNTWMTEGEDSNHWKNLRRITGTLVWTLIPKDSEEQRKKLLDTLRPLLQALTKGMELIQADSDERNRVFQMLMLEHAKVVKQTSRNIASRPAMSAKQAGIDEASSVESNAVDIELGADETGEADMVEAEEDALSAISGEETESVIRNLEDFTSCVVKGEIEVDEEIVIASEPEIRIDDSQPEASREALEQVQSLQVGDWIEFLQDDGRWQHARLSWKSNVTGKLVFVNRHGRKLRDTRVRRLASEFAAGKARPLESVSVFDRAIHSILSGIRS